MLLSPELQTRFLAEVARRKVPQHFVADNDSVDLALKLFGRDNNLRPVATIFGHSVFLLAPEGAAK